MQAVTVSGLLFVFLFAPLFAKAAEYTVGEGDVLKITVYENDDLSSTVRVSATGTIRLPLLGETDVNKFTVSQVASKIEKLLADGYLVDPQVDVFISEYRSKKAAILGQIQRPGQYELRGRITFLEFISKAGGLKADAGNTATVKRQNTENGTIQHLDIDLQALIKHGKTELNILIQDNDSIYIAKSKTYYVSGEVNKPDSYKHETDVTVIKAITMAGGFSKIAAKNKVKIIRQIDGKEHILANVKMDEPVLADDVIVVPESFF